MLQTFWGDVINLYAVSRCVTGRISICYLRTAVKTMVDLLRRLIEVFPFLLRHDVDRTQGSRQQRQQKPLHTASFFPLRAPLF